MLEAVCEACPEGSTVVILTRSQPPDWLARVRATGRLTEVSVADLDFDLDETTQLLSAMGVTAQRADAAVIVDHTEGWAVGVYLTALGLRSGERVGAGEARVVRGSDRIVADYLRTQVLATLSDDHRQFLTRTSVLDELNGPVCDAVLQRTDSASVLAHLHRQIQLVIALDPEERRFRCHHLLREELAGALQTFESARIPGLQERASRWFDEHGDREAAIRHATASGSADLAAAMIWPAVPNCVASGRLDRLRTWLSGLTDAQIASNPWLSMAATWSALQQGDAPTMGRWARISEGHAGPNWREDASHDPYAATVAVLHGLVGSGGLDDTRDLCDRAMGGLAPDDSVRAAAAFNRGIAMALLRDLEGGQASLVEADTLAAALGVPVIEANAKSFLGLMALGAGERERGIRLISEAAEVTRRHHVDRLATGALSSTAQALVLALVGDTTAATSPDRRNVISGTETCCPDSALLPPAYGITLNGTAAGNRIEGNYIGTAADGVTPLGNAWFGIGFESGSAATNLTIGGTLPGAGNVIAFNGRVAPNNPFFGGGIRDPASARGTAILGNSIHSNIGLGIQGDLVNSLEGIRNFPLLSSALSSNGLTTIQGRLQGVSNALHRIEFFADDTLDPSSHGEGRFSSAQPTSRPTRMASSPLPPCCQPPFPTACS